MPLSSESCCSGKTPEVGEAVWVLPGELEAEEHCGEIEGKKVCEDCHAESVLIRHCDRIGCSVCGGRAQRRTVKEVTDRVDCVSKALGISPRHIVVSVPDSVYGWPLPKMRAWMWNQIKERTGGKKWLKGLYAGRTIGLRGAVVFFHPFRFRDREGHEVAWKTYCLSPEGLYHRVFSPHFHMLAWGMVPNTEVLYEATGFVVKVKGGRVTKRDIGGTVKYVLSHSGVSTVTNVRRQTRYYRMVQEHRIPIKAAVAQSDDLRVDVTSFVRDTKMLWYYGVMSQKYVIMHEWREREVCPECGGKNLVAEYDNGQRVICRVQKRSFKFRTELLAKLNDGG